MKEHSNACVLRLALDVADGCTCEKEEVVKHSEAPVYHPMDRSWEPEDITKIPPAHPGQGVKI